MEPGLLWLQLAGAAAVILAASTHLARSADVIALKTGLGRSFVGVVLVATATSIPELGTGVSAITVVGEPNLAVGDALGSCILNLAAIALLDLYWRQGPLLRRATATTAAVGVLGVAVTAIAAIAMFVHSVTDWFSAWPVSPFTIVLGSVFVAAMYLIYRIDRSEDGPRAAADRYGATSLFEAGLRYAVSAAVVIGAAVWLARTGEGITHAMGWDASFVGTQFLAVCTSLPEIAASFAALRLNAPELALSNLLGSNLFNVGFVLTVDDLVLVGQPLWSSISSVHALTAAFAILMTSLVTMALAAGRTQGRRGFVSVPTGVLVVLYAAASVMVFAFG